MRPRLKQKILLVDQLVNSLKAAKIVAIVSLDRVPALQLRSVRRALGVNLIIKPKNVLARALKKSGYSSLIPELNGVCGLLLLDESAFKIVVKLVDFRVDAVARPGVIAEKDIILEKGPTAFMPGELMTSLTALGVNVNPKGGKINIVDDMVLVKAGEEVSDVVADLLLTMGLRPVKVGLKLIAASEGGKIFTKDDLSFDVELIRGDLVRAHLDSVNLSVNEGIVNKFTIEYLLLKAFVGAKNLVLNAAVVTNDNINDLMFTARAKVLGLANTINWEVK